MSIFLERDNLFGDFSDEPEAVAAWADLEYIFTEVLPALKVAPEVFDKYIDNLQERTQKFLAILFSQTDDPNIGIYGVEWLEHINDSYANGVNEFLTDGPVERVLGGHEYFIKEAIFDVLYNVCEEYEHDIFCGKHNPVQKFNERFKPFKNKYLEHVADAHGFITSELGAHYAAYAQIDDEYKACQDEGLERFTNSYIQNHKLIEAIKDRIAELSSKRWMCSLAQDFNRNYEMKKCKFEFCGLVENMLAEAFDVDIPKRKIDDLNGSLAEHNGKHRRITYDSGYLYRASLNHLLDTVIHEFGHHLQREVQLDSNIEEKFIHRDTWDRMVFFFHTSLYRNGDRSEFLYNHNILERDANDFASRAFSLLARKQMHHDVDTALQSLMQPNAADG